MIDPTDYGITDEEFLRIRKDLGREPNHVEMGVFSAMWSEHCSYKHTKSLLEQLPTRSEFVVQGPGENAGVVAVNEDWNIVYKIESHNHPSFVAPYDGAATGVGGLLRDVMAMGARPLGVKALLRFGDPAAPENAALIKEVRRGAADYSAVCDVASLGEELFVHTSYKTNPLVNVIVLGLARNDALMHSSAGDIGNKFVYFGRATGSHGVDGASFASKGMDEDTEAHPPAGDAVVGKELMDAALHLIEKGLLEGLQDMGAAGLTSSSFEMAFKAGHGFSMNLDALPKTSDLLGAYELLLSETQERMLAAVKPENVDAVMETLKAYPCLDCAVIGEVTGDQQAVITHNGQHAASLPVELVVDGFIRYEIRAGRGNDLGAAAAEALGSAVESTASIRVDTSLDGNDLKASQLHPAAADENYGPCSAVILPHCNKTILLRTISNGADIEIDPYASVYHAAAQAYQDLKAQGAQPIALSDGLNCGDPDDPRTAWQIQEGIRGLADACRELHVPVVGGNVSLYNQTQDSSILSQFIIGMIGIMDTAEVS